MTDSILYARGRRYGRIVAAIVLFALFSALSLALCRGWAFAQEDALHAGEPVGRAAAEIGLLTQADSRDVYIARKSSNKIYHYDPACSGMKNPSSMTLVEAQAAGYRGCEKCVTTAAAESDSGADEPVAESGVAGDSESVVPAAESSAAVDSGTGAAEPVTYGGAMYRLYNRSSGEHFFTANAEERDYLDSIGWDYEGVAWNAPDEGEPVYRLYNRSGGEHHYTPSADERDFLVSAGWEAEGVGWMTAGEGGVPLYRVYNPNAFANNHHYTTDASERDWLVGLGWRDEHIGWFGV